MKLLLTSAGLTNNSLKNTLKELVNGEIKTAFIPTAANLDDGDKEWLVQNLQEFQELGYIDIVDISSVPKDNWMKRLEKVNVIAFGGGNTKYLMEKIVESGLDKELPELLKNKVYVGISAGSIILSQKIWCDSEFLYEDEVGKAPDGLNYIKINFRPHYNSPHFSKVRKDVLAEVSKNNPDEIIYACDDDSGLLILDEDIKIISEGKCDIFEQK